MGFGGGGGSLRIWRHQGCQRFHNSRCRWQGKRRECQKVSAVMHVYFHFLCCTASFPVLQFHDVRSCIIQQCGGQAEEKQVQHTAYTGSIRQKLHTALTPSKCRDCSEEWSTHRERACLALWRERTRSSCTIEPPYKGREMLGVSPFIPLPKQQNDKLWSIKILYISSYISVCVGMPRVSGRMFNPHKLYKMSIYCHFIALKNALTPKICLCSVASY